jgi:hypothetical protein
MDEGQPVRAPRTPALKDSDYVTRGYVTETVAAHGRLVDRGARETKREFAQTLSDLTMELEERIQYVEESLVRRITSERAAMLRELDRRTIRGRLRRLLDRARGRGVR